MQGLDLQQQIFWDTYCPRHLSTVQADQSERLKRRGATSRIGAQLGLLLLVKVWSQENEMDETGLGQRDLHVNLCAPQQHGSGCI